MSSDQPAKGSPEGGSAEPGRIDRRVIHDGRRLLVSLDRVRFPDGSEGELEMIEHPGAAAILPVFGSLEEPDPEIALIRQYRYAAGGYIYEVPAGVPDHPGEPWEVCAHRELEEETGYRAESLVPLTSIYTTPGFTDEVIHLYVATGLSAGETNLDADEFVELRRLRFSQAVNMVRAGDITDCKSVATILYAAAFVIGRDPAA